MSDPDQPDLHEMFFDKNMRRNMRELAFVKALGEMPPKDFISVLTTLLELWSRSAVHHASQVVLHDPSNGEAITVFMQVFHRSGTIQSLLETLAKSDHPIDPSPALLKESIDELLKIVRFIKP